MKKNIFFKINFSILISVFLVFTLIFSLVFWFFYINSNKYENISVSWKWYNLSQKNYINEKSPKFNNWDLIKRTIILKNNWFFDVENFLIEDYNPFTKSSVKFSANINAWETTQKSYKVLASKIENFNVKIKTKEKDFIDIQSKPIIWKKNISKPFWTITWISINKINNDFDQYFEVYWKNLNSIENIFINCWKKSETFNIAIYKDNKISIQIDKWSLWNWNCQVWTFFNWIAFFSDFSFESKKSDNQLWVAIKNITPREISSKKWWALVFQWSWFKKIVAAQIDNWTILDLNFLKIINDNILIVNVPKKFKKWEYFFRLLTKKWVLELKNLKIQIK